MGERGGGRQELVGVAGGKGREAVSLPRGVLRIPEVRGEGNGWLERHVKKLLQKCGWDKATRDLPFYLVGRSWRALARLDMHLTGIPLLVIHHYEMKKELPERMARVLVHKVTSALKSIHYLLARLILQTLATTH